MTMLRIGLVGLFSRDWEIATSSPFYFFLKTTPFSFSLLFCQPKISQGSGTASLCSKRRGEVMYVSKKIDAQRNV